MPMSNQDQSDDFNPYYVLGVEIGETDEAVLKEAYRLACQGSHPDHFSDPEEKARAAAFFQNVQTARDLVRNLQWREGFLARYYARTAAESEQAGDTYNQEGQIVYKNGGLHCEV